MARRVNRRSTSLQWHWPAVPGCSFGSSATHTNQALSPADKEKCFSIDEEDDLCSE